MFRAIVKSQVLSIYEENKKLFEYPVIQKDTSFDIFGVYGSFTFNSQSYLVLVMNAASIGMYNRHPVFEIRKVKVLGLLQPEVQMRSVRECAQMISYVESFFSQPGMYFSGATIYKRTGFVDGKESNDQEFLFNRSPTDHFTSICKQIGNTDGTQLVLNCIQGYYGRYKDLVLISRRSPTRAGCRYFSRGLNKDGYPSNMVETEQIIERKSSYVHLRGSIPLRWRHIIGLKYKPLVQIDKSFTEADAKSSHAILERIYDMPIVYLNLIHKTGYESQLFRVYNEKYGKIVDLRNYDIVKAIPKVKMPVGFAETGFNSEGSKQRMVIRTNCVDCLDRTNAAQYVIGGDILWHQLKKAGVNDKDSINKYGEALKKLFKANGDNLSLQYAGTRAQNTFFISHGHPTILTMLVDGVSSLTRYFIGRYKQGRIQDVYEILTGARKEGKMPTERSIFNLKFIFLMAPIILSLLVTQKPNKLVKLLLVFGFLWLVVMCLNNMSCSMSYYEVHEY